MCSVFGIGFGVFQRRRRTTGNTGKPVPTPKPTVTPSPTATPMPEVKPTVTPKPTATPSPTPTPTVKPTVTPTPTAPAELYVYGYAPTLVFLGCLTCSEYSTASVFNPYGSYGSEYSSTSMLNRYSQWGSSYSDTSACNSFATHPPIVIRGSNTTIGFLTRNTAVNNALRGDTWADLLDFLCEE
jgi:hypothetical protein